MKKTVIWFIAIMIVAGLLIGITAGDLWQYIVDFMSAAVHWFIAWINEVIVAIRDSLNQATAANSGFVS